jgi:serine/threonine protein kinase
MALAARHRTAGDELGQRFAHVQLLRSGTRFTIYEAHETNTGRPVVVKVPHDVGPRWLYETLDEQATVLANVGSHPNIITLYQRFTLDDGRPALVLERCGASLSESLRDGGRLSASAVATIGIKLAGALGTVHRAGVIHCDVRPGNILLSEWDEPVLAGFDEAVHVGPSAAGRSSLQVTRAHTAPELLQGEDATPRTDVYGLAATLYELVAGRSAFRAYAGESPAAIIVRVLSGQVRPIIADDVPLALSDLLTWAMSGDPAARPPSPAWLAEELARIELAEGWPRTRMLGG